MADTAGRLSPYSPAGIQERQTVYGYYRLWVKLEVWHLINDTLVEQVRLEAGRDAQPTLRICDSASVKLGKKGGQWKSAVMATNSSKDENGTSWLMS